MLNSSATASLTENIQPRQCSPIISEEYQLPEDAESCVVAET